MVVVTDNGGLAWLVILVKGVAALQEIIFDDALLLIVPRCVDGIPFSVVHFNVVPHMPFFAGRCFADTADKRARNVESVAKHLESFCVALTDISSCPVEKRCCRVGLGVVLVSQFIVIVDRILTDVIMNVFNGFVP